MAQIGIASAAESGFLEQRGFYQGGCDILRVTLCQCNISVELFRGCRALLARDALPGMGRNLRTGVEGICLKGLTLAFDSSR